MPNETEHSELFSPSSMFRRILCPGSANLEKDIIETGPNPAADWGTYAHHIVEKVLVDKADPLSFLGKEKFGQVCDDEMLDCVAQFIIDTDQLLKRFPPDGPLEVEKNLSLKHLGHDDVFGTADVVYEQMFTALVILDYKSGRGPVDPRNNPQLMTYAAMASQGNLVGFYDHIVIAVSQPRGMDDAKSLKVWKIKPRTLETFTKKVLIPTIEKIKAGDDTLNPSAEACQWCNAQGVCPAFTGKAIEISKVDLVKPDPVPPVIDDNFVLKAYPHVDMLKALVKNIEGHAFGMAQEGRLPGYKVVHGRNSRSWADEEAAREVILKAGFQPFVFSMMTPPAAEKLNPKVKKAIQPLIKINPGRPTIADESDKRPAITKAQDDFKEFIKEN